MREKLRRTGCESPNHNRECPCLTCITRDCARCPLLTLDHLTPKCIAFNVLGWNYKQVNRKENLQWLSEPCHKDKDRPTERVYRQLQMQQQGVFIRLGEHIT